MRSWIWIGLAVILVVTLSWHASDLLEARNQFCVACHLPGGELLHESKHREFLAAPAPSLAAAHRLAKSEFRCIDCHGGASFVNKLRVKTVAARDVVRWLVGRFDEPQRMRHPLWDEDCVQCHSRYHPQRKDDFHAIDDHNVDFAHRCVECHLAHPSTGSAELAYLDRAHALPVCRNCHEEF